MIQVNYDLRREAGGGIKGTVATNKADKIDTLKLWGGKT